MTFRLTTSFAKAKAKPTPRSPQLLVDVVLFDTDTSEWVIQLGVRVKTPNRTRKESRWAEKARRSEEKTAIWNTCLTHLGSIDRALIEHVQFTRFSPQELDKKDNLPASFKNVLDALCSWIWNGPRVWQDGMKNYGKHDGWLEETGKFTWHYNQKTYERLQGIQVRLRLGSPPAPSREP